MPTEITMRALLEAGVHFGHRTRRWNPKMRPYIFTERNGIHIIDLGQTLEALHKAYEAVQRVSANGGQVLFAGTKRQAQDIIVQQAQRAGMPYVNERWLGGTLTNFRTIYSRVEYLLDLENRKMRGELELLPKKERLNIDREIDKLNRRLGGLKNMNTLPDMLYVVDVYREDIAVHEADILDIPVVAMVDTNSDPTPVDIVIPSNDDAIRAIRLITSYIADAVVEGQQMREAALIEELEAESEALEAYVPERRVFSPEDEPEEREEYEEYEEEFEEEFEDEEELEVARRRRRSRRRSEDTKEERERRKREERLARLRQREARTDLD